MTLSVGLGQPLAASPELGPDWSRRGVGLSDGPPLAPALASRLLYTNTYYQEYPQLDITRPPAILIGQLEFIICSDVLEHVPPPLEPALEGLYACLRPGGIAVVTVPVGPGTTHEYYPGLVEFELAAGESGGHVLDWIDTAGARHTDTTPEIHGGGGLTLAFRLLAARDIEARLRTAGFASVSEPPPMPELGVPKIAYPGVFLARKGDARP